MPVAAEEQGYLRDSLEKNICPACKKPPNGKIGSGRRKDGLFCSLDCYARWHEGGLLKRHRERLRKGPALE